MKHEPLAMQGSAAFMSSAPAPGSNAGCGAPSTDVYFSADIETDGPIPGEFSMLSFALVYAGRYDGVRFERPATYSTSFETTLRPISARFEPEALEVNGLDRQELMREGRDPAAAMADAAEWIREHAAGGTPVLVAYPLSFDWTWLYWYFVRFTNKSPFNHSRCFDLKTAIAVRGRRTVSTSGHDRLPAALTSEMPHTHRALDDAIEQADILAKLFAWDGT
jgi:DNA polymerase III epsilon subunit-like protein